MKIEIPEDTLCILENCIFQNNANCHKILKLIGGSFEIINPILINIKDEIDSPIGFYNECCISSTNILLKK